MADRMESWHLIDRMRFRVLFFGSTIAFGFMRDPYSHLLEATIHYLEGLKARGAQFVAVSPQALGGLEESSLTPLKSRTAPGFTVNPASVPSPKPVVHEPKHFTPLSSPAMAVVSASPLAPVSSLSPAAKEAAFRELRERAMSCMKCAHLASSRKSVVFGVGNINAQLMFVGEAPGADEDEQGEPFVGKAGQLLTRILQTMGLSRDSVYIANILKCRPDTPGQSSGNRKPAPAEMQTCIPFLHEQIDLIAPKVLVALGATAVEGLLGKTIGITRLRGQWRTYRGIPLMPTYHPAYLLHNQVLSEKRHVWEDMLQVMETLGLTISEKQRGYFL